MTSDDVARFSMGALLLAAIAFSLAPTNNAHAEDDLGTPVTVHVADPNEQGDGTMGPAAAAARSRGPLPFGPATVARKEAADRAYDEAMRTAIRRPLTAHELAATGQLNTPNAPLVFDAFAGLAGGSPNTSSSPPDNEGAIGPTRYIQTINTAARIFDRPSNTIVDTGSLNDLAGNAASVNSFDPQIIWDATTNRFYYAMDSIVSSTDNRLAIGFSKNASPGNLTTDWCHYYIAYGTPFPDYPKLGDSRYFMIIGVNVFNPGFVGSDIVAVSKPGKDPITTCPAANSFKTGRKANLKDPNNNQVFTPVPANQIDPINTGYVVAMSGFVPSNKLWLFSVLRHATTGNPSFRNARRVTVPSYTSPANARQPDFTQVLDTLDGRNTQAIQALNPRRAGTVYSFWTQHTVANGSTASAVRWYEINPASNPPTLLDNGEIAANQTFIFNAAISPDRLVRNTSRAFGNNFVIQYNVSSSTNNIAPRIVARSSVNGGPLSGATLIRNGVFGYRDFTCPTGGSVCRWGDYAAATPDPVPQTSGRGKVWSTNQYSGVVSPPAGAVNWRTWIFSIRP